MYLIMERERAVRFSNLEMQVLVDLIKTHINTEVRRTDCTANTVKRRPWESIATEFWSRTSSYRTEFQLLKKWKNLKHAARKYEAAMHGKDESALGRGPPSPSPILEEVLNVMKREQQVSALNTSREIDSTIRLSTKIEVEESVEHSEASKTWQCSEENVNYVQESCDDLPQDVCTLEIQQQLKNDGRGECSSLLKVMDEKESAIKSAQLMLLEKEKQIKDLDIRIRQEQLTDIIIRRKQDQELHDLRKKRMQQYLVGESRENYVIW